MIKSQDILLISIIIILIIVICHCKRVKTEGFISNDIFNEKNLEDVSTKIEQEKVKIEKINNEFNTIIKRDTDQYYVKDPVTGIYRKPSIDDIKKGALTINTLSALVDIENMVKINATKSNK